MLLAQERRSEAVPKELDASIGDCSLISLQRERRLWLEDAPFEFSRDCRPGSFSEDLVASL